jgi:exonuclease III
VRNKISAPQATFLSIDMTSKRPSSGPVAIKTNSINIEGFSSNNGEIMAEICIQNECDVICGQETHRDQNSIHPKIKNMKLIVEIPNNKYGSAIFVRHDLKFLSKDFTDHNDIEILTIELTNCTTTSIYKPQGIPLQFIKPKNFDNQIT